MRKPIVAVAVMAAFSLAGCGATAGWFHSQTTQQAVAGGCAAVAIDDNRNNKLANATIPYPEVLAAVNTAHAAIQAALKACQNKVSSVSALSAEAEK